MKDKGKLRHRQTYSEVDLCGRKREVSKARNDHTFTISQLFGDIGAETSPNRPQLLFIESTSHLGLHSLLDQRDTLSSTTPRKPSPCQVDCSKDNLNIVALASWLTLSSSVMSCAACTRYHCRRASTPYSASHSLVCFYWSLRWPTYSRCADGCAVRSAGSESDHPGPSKASDSGYRSSSQ